RPRRGLHGWRARLFGPRACAPARRRADARRLSRGGRAGGAASRHAGLLRKAMSVALVVLLIGLILAGVSAAVGVAAATVSQHELTRWVAYKLRGSPATAGVLQNPGRTIAAANMLTTLGVLLAAARCPRCSRRRPRRFWGY